MYSYAGMQHWLYFQSLYLARQHSLVRDTLSWWRWLSSLPWSFLNQKKDSLSANTFAPNLDKTAYIQSLWLLLSAQILPLWLLLSVVILHNGCCLCKIDWIVKNGKQHQKTILHTNLSGFVTHENAIWLIVMVTVDVFRPLASQVGRYHSINRTCP